MLVPLAISLFNTTGLRTSISSAKKDGPSSEGPSFFKRIAPRIPRNPIERTTRSTLDSIGVSINLDYSPIRSINYVVV